MSGHVVAFDYGLKHIGVAVGQTITRSASPIATLGARNGKPDWEAVRQLVKDWDASRLLVGLPLNMDGTESDMSGRARAFADELQLRSGIEVTLVDERLTSFEAAELERNRERHSGPGARDHTPSPRS